MSYKNNPPILNSFPPREKEAARAFTLVELIVVITILAILGTIAFISLQGYSASSRDSVRISDVSNMKTSLELFHLNAGKYPLPDNDEIVSYNSETLWYQGIFGSTVVSQLSRNINEIPTDSLTDKEYIYSVANNKNEFEILNLLEADLAYRPHPGISSPLGEKEAAFLIRQTNAANTTRIPRIDGQYNGVFIKTAKDIVPTPSIITSENLPMVLNGANIQSQIITGGKNIPNIGGVNPVTGELDVTLSVYNGTIDKDSTPEDKVLAMQAIQGAYTGSVLANSDIYAHILSKTSTGDLLALVDTIILKNNTTVSSTTINTVISFPTMCGNGDIITYQQAQDNKATIIGDINNYIGCIISDYPGGENSKIAGITVSSNILVVSASDDSVGIQWGYNGTTTNATSLDDGYTNTNLIKGISGTAGHLCWNKYIIVPGTWYLPAKDELNTVYTNKSNLGTFVSNKYYWSSNEASYNSAWCQSFTTGVQIDFSSSKPANYLVRCVSRF